MNYLGSPANISLALRIYLKHHTVTYNLLTDFLQ